MSLVFRAFFAPMQMALASPTGMPTKAIYIFVRTLSKLLKDHHSSHVAVAFDLSAPTFRDKLFDEYKANRPEFPPDLAVQLPYVKRFCRALGLPLVELEGFEADDVIGTLAREGAAQGGGRLYRVGRRRSVSVGERPEFACSSLRAREAMAKRSAMRRR